MPPGGCAPRPRPPLASASRHTSGLRPRGPRARTTPLSSRTPLQRAREGAAVEQDVLAGDEAGLGAAEERAGQTEFLRVAEAAGRILLGALGDHLVLGDAAL